MTFVKWGSTTTTNHTIFKIVLRSEIAMDRTSEKHTERPITTIYATALVGCAARDDLGRFLLPLTRHFSHPHDPILSDPLDPTQRVRFDCTTPSDAHGLHCRSRCTLVCTGSG